MSRRHKPFTLVEVLLALGVCAIGICSIMVLFPVGASASRDAAARTYVANFADDLLHLKEYEILQDWDAQTQVSKIARPSDVKTFCEKSGNLHPLNEEEKLTPKILEKLQNYSGGWTQTSEMRNFNPGMYEMNGHPEVFQIVAKRGKNGDYENDIDFRCIALLWQENLPDSIPNTMATRLKLEVSWPAEIPYNQRQKSIFTLELFNNKR